MHQLLMSFCKQRKGITIRSSFQLALQESFDICIALIHQELTLHSRTGCNYRPHDLQHLTTPKIGFTSLPHLTLKNHVDSFWKLTYLWILVYPNIHDPPMDFSSLSSTYTKLCKWNSHTYMNWSLLVQFMFPSHKVRAPKILLVTSKENGALCIILYF